MDHIGSLLVGIGVVCAAFESDIIASLCVGETGWCVLRATQGGNQLAMR